jgi:hypothetical protein
MLGKGARLAREGGRHLASEGASLRVNYNLLKVDEMIMNFDWQLAPRRPRH